MTAAEPVPGKSPPPELPLRAAPPAAVRLRRSAVQIAVLGAAGVLASSLAWAFVVQPELRERARTRGQEPAQTAEGTVRPSETVTAAPASYDGLAGDQLPEPRRLAGERDAPATPDGRQPAPAGPAPVPRTAPRQARSLSTEARQSGLFFPASAQADRQREATDGPAAVERAEYGAAYSGHRLLPPLSPYELKAGTILPATLLTGIDTEGAGPVVATVTQNVFDTVSGRHLLVPQGTRLIGRHDGDSRYGDRRAFLVWERLILPNGKSLLLDKEPGVDAQGAVGVRGRVDRRLLPLMGAALLAGAVTTLGEVARGEDDGGGFWGDAGDAASIEAAQVGGRLIDRELDVRPAIRLRPGAHVRVLITRDLILEPYRP
ncbi:TrbI/VirB10 family protein [Phenylobacterium terrae]|uniref:TrbI/VirB10 family protein n=1 Tax=Phenylobacterium terrae TaxID=2665495 RepID=A0ABW4N736_9CAUL